MATADTAENAENAEPLVVRPGDFDILTREGIDAFRAASDAADAWVPRYESSNVVEFARLREGNRIVLTDEVVAELGLSTGSELVIYRTPDGALALDEVNRHLANHADDEVALQTLVAWIDD